jgi:hypothetical protein
MELSDVVAAFAAPMMKKLGRISILRGHFSGHAAPADNMFSDRIGKDDRHIADIDFRVLPE